MIVCTAIGYHSKLFTVGVGGCWWVPVGSINYFLYGVTIFAVGDFFPSLRFVILEKRLHQFRPTRANLCYSINAGEKLFFLEILLPSVELIVFSVWDSCFFPASPKFTFLAQVKLCYRNFSLA